MPTGTSYQCEFRLCSQTDFRIYLCIMRCIPSYVSTSWGPPRIHNENGASHWQDTNIAPQSGVVIHGARLCNDSDGRLFISAVPSWHVLWACGDGDSVRRPLFPPDPIDVRAFRSMMMLLALQLRGCRQASQFDRKCTLFLTCVYVYNMICHDTQYLDINDQAPGSLFTIMINTELWPHPEEKLG